MSNVPGKLDTSRSIVAVAVRRILSPLVRLSNEDKILSTVMTLLMSNSLFGSKLGVASAPKGMNSCASTLRPGFLGVALVEGDEVLFVAGFGDNLLSDDGVLMGVVFDVTGAVGGVDDCSLVGVGCFTSLLDDEGQSSNCP